MLYEDSHPDVMLSDWQSAWQKYLKEFAPHLVDEVIDRHEAGCLPDWFVPLARGVVIASDELLRHAGHCHGMHRPRGWREVDPDCYSQVIGDKGVRWPDVLVVRRCDKHEWWMIERRVADVDEVLVFNFGSTPIFTRSPASAMRLATYCNVSNPPHGLLWVKQTPDDCSGAIEFAYQRDKNEALGANCAQAEGHLR